MHSSVRCLYLNSLKDFAWPSANSEASSPVRALRKADVDRLFHHDPLAVVARYASSLIFLANHHRLEVYVVRSHLPTHLLSANSVTSGLRVVKRFLMISLTLLLPLCPGFSDCIAKLPPDSWFVVCVMKSSRERAPNPVFILARKGISEGIVAVTRL